MTAPALGELVRPRLGSLELRAERGQVLLVPLRELGRVPVVQHGLWSRRPGGMV